jgi:RNase P/RNase MRP subunit p30
MTKTIIGIARPELFEDKRVSHIIDMESGRRDDFIHHRNSGLNQVFIESAKRTDKTLLVDAHQLLFERIPPAVVLGRIMQNNIFYKKYAPRALVISGASEPLEMRPWRDLQNLLRV